MIRKILANIKERREKRKERGKEGKKKKKNLLVLLLIVGDFNFAMLEISKEKEKENK